MCGYTVILDIYKYLWLHGKIIKYNKESIATIELLANPGSSFLDKIHELIVALIFYMIMELKLRPRKVRSCYATNTQG